jgi:hypothetical protein
MVLAVSRGSADGIETAYGPDDRGVGVQIPEVLRIFTPPYRPDRLWGPPNLLSNGSEGSFPGDKVARAWSCTLNSN